MDHKKLGLPENALNDEEQTWLSNQSTEFMQYRCVDCSDLELNMDIFHNNKESITFHQWIRVDNKIQKSEIDEIRQEFNNDIKVLKKTHLRKT